MSEDQLAALLAKLKDDAGSILAAGLLFSVWGFNPAAYLVMPIGDWQDTNKAVVYHALTKKG